MLKLRKCCFCLLLISIPRKHRIDLSEIWENILMGIIVLYFEFKYSYFRELAFAALKLVNVLKLNFYFLFCFVRVCCKMHINLFSFWNECMFDFQLKNRKKINVKVNSDANFIHVLHVSYSWNLLFFVFIAPLLNCFHWPTKNHFSL